jgi:hypothetical protein
MVKPSGNRHDSYIALLNSIRDNPIAIKEKVQRPTKPEPPSVSPTQPDGGTPVGPLKPFPGFQQNEASGVRVMIATNILEISMDELSRGQVYKFPRLTGFPAALPVSIYIKNGVLCADISMSGGAWDVRYEGFQPEDIKLNCYKFQVDNPNYDVNSSKNAFEVVRYARFRYSR